VTDESGSKKRIRLENNIVRWRTVRNPDGTTSVSDYLLLLSVIHTHMHNRVVKHNYSYKERQKSKLL